MAVGFESEFGRKRLFGALTLTVAIVKLKNRIVWMHLSGLEPIISW